MGIEEGSDVIVVRKSVETLFLCWTENLVLECSYVTDYEDVTGRLCLSGRNWRLVRKWSAMMSVRYHVCPSLLLLRGRLSG